MPPAKTTAFQTVLKEKLGIVSYTYRNSFSKDISATLNSIKAMSITNIEFSNLFGKTAADIIDIAAVMKAVQKSGIQY